MGEDKLGGVMLTIVELYEIADTVSDVDLTIEASGAKDDETIVGTEKPECGFSVVSTAAMALPVGETWEVFTRVGTHVEGLEDCRGEVSAVIAFAGAIDDLICTVVSIDRESDC